MSPSPRLSPKGERSLKEERHPNLMHLSPLGERLGEGAV